MKHDREYNICKLLSDDEFAEVISIVREILDNLYCIFGNTIDTQIVEMHINDISFQDIETILGLENGYAERAYKARIELLGSCLEAALLEYFGDGINLTMPMFSELDEEYEKLKVIDAMLSKRSNTRYNKKVVKHTLF